MNFLMYHYEYSGDVYTTMIADAMTQKCNLIAKRKTGWYEYTQKEKTWKPLRSVMSILQGDNNVINWGNHIFRENEYFKLNVPSAISRTSHKTTARKILQNAGVKVPQTYFYDDNINLQKFPLIARPPKHEKGKNFFVLNSQKDFEHIWNQNGGNIKDWYFSEIFEKTNEYRVHVAHGKVLLVNEKSFKKGDIVTTAEVNRGDWRVLNWGEFNPRICMESIRAAEILGLDYAAVDVMYNSDNNTLAICELNTDPDVGTQYTSGKYAAYFDWAIRHDFPEHFKLENGTNVFYTENLKR